ncbi:hypothetical protein [Rhizobium laguerreae]|uniref:hypothetical protein n=1 Tax=Rhizobium laguerreae TaxID=1076926 RepID=UPI001D1D2FD3|nr:hypothetical protein [Rhizobium laguerreae]MBY3556862.1 hypothetical protein [Rhizobium laguerreae]
MVLPISEGYALRYFLLYALTCTLVGIVLLFIVREVVPFAIDKPAYQSVADSTDEPVAGPTDQSAVQPADPLVVRSTGQPVDGPAREPGVGKTGEPAARPTDQSVTGPPGEPVVRKGGRLGSPAQ